MKRMGKPSLQKEDYQPENGKNELESAIDRTEVILISISFQQLVLAAQVLVMFDLAICSNRHPGLRNGRIDAVGTIDRDES